MKVGTIGKRWLIDHLGLAPIEQMEARGQRRRLSGTEQVPLPEVLLPQIPQLPLAQLPLALVPLRRCNPVS